MMQFLLLSFLGIRLEALLHLGYLNTCIHDVYLHNIIIAILDIY